jgi:hypothetical protein
VRFFPNVTTLKLYQATHEIADELPGEFLATVGDMLPVALRPSDVTFVAELLRLHMKIAKK